LFKAIGDAISHEKSYCYGWKWQYKYGDVKICDIEVNVRIHDKKILQIESRKSFRTLGVYINPTLAWDE